MPKNLRVKFILLLLSYVVIDQSILAQASFNGSSNYYEDFGTSNIPSWTNNSTFLGWYVYPTSVFINNTVNITGAAPTNAGGIYTYMCNGNNDVKLGMRPSDSKVASGTFCPPPCNYPPPPADCFFFGLELNNNTGTTITSITVSFDWFQLSQSQDGGITNFDFFDYQVGATENNLAAAGVWTHVSALDFSGPDIGGTCCSAQIKGDPCNETGNNSACIDLSATPILPGQEIMLRWTDPDNDHNDPHMAVDNISVTANIINTTNSAPVICAGDSSTITVNGPATGYTWVPATGLSASTGATIKAAPTGNTTYTITGTFAGGCTSTQTVSVAVSSAATLTVTPVNAKICPGDSTTINIAGASNYAWSPATGLNSTTGSSVISKPPSTLTYTIVGTSALGCNDTTQVAITVVPFPVVGIFIANDTVCAGKSTSMIATGATSYIWKPSIGLNNTSGDTVIATPPASPMLYKVIGSNGTCIDSAQQVIYSYPQLTLTANKYDTNCPGQNAQIGITVTGGKPGYNYNWINASPVLPNGPGPYTVSPSSSIYYVCVVTDGCGSQKDSDLVLVNPASKAIFTANPDTVWAGQTINFMNTSTGSTSYYWNFGDGNSSVNFSPNNQYSTSGDYLVYLLTSNSFGCVDSTADSVFVEAQGNITVPNVFTPNGDGINDGFHITTSGLQTYTIDIYNRWGEKVFRADSPQIDWLGRDFSGTEQSDGVYYYIINATDYANKKYKLSGFLQLIQ